MEHRSGRRDAIDEEERRWREARNERLEENLRRRRRAEAAQSDARQQSPSAVAAGAATVAQSNSSVDHRGPRRIRPEDVVYVRRCSGDWDEVARGARGSEEGSSVGEEEVPGVAPGGEAGLLIKRSSA